MLQRRESSEGVVWYESPLLRGIGVRHAFSTRIGGVSSGVFSSLNMGNPSGCAEQDPRENILENERRLMRAAGIDPGSVELCRVHQVHGNAVEIVHTKRPHNPHVQADALVTTDTTRIVSVRVADCVPVLLASADGRAVAAVHAGWRGVVSGVVRAAAMQIRRLSGADLIAAIGPGIGEDAFEVDGEVARVFLNILDWELRDRTDPLASGVLAKGYRGKWHIDLKRTISEQLGADGCLSVDATDRCSVRDADEFFSHRRDKGVTGRMAAFITPAIGAEQRKLPE
jgi:YfiH family protein